MNLQRRSQRYLRDNADLRSGRDQGPGGGAVIGGAALAVVLWLFEKEGPWAWVYGWGAPPAPQIVLVYLAPFVAAVAYSIRAR